MNIKKVFCALTCAVLTAGLVFSPVSRSSGLGETVYAGTQSVPLTMDEVPSYDNYGKNADEAALAELYDEHMGMTNAEALSVLSEKPADLSAAKSVDDIRMIRNNNTSILWIPFIYAIFRITINGYCINITLFS